MLRRHLGALLATGLALVPRAAWASAAARLTYVRGTGAERCADEAELRKAVAARVGYDLFFPWAQKTVVVEVSVARPSGYHGVVQIVDDHGLTIGQRSLDSSSDDCADLVRALALAISIAVDDRSLEYVPPPATEEPPAPPSVETPVAPTAPPVPEPPEAPLPPPSAPSLSFSAWATPIVALDVAPSLAVGAEADVVGRLRSISLALGLRADAPASGPAPVGGSVGTWLVAGTVAPCLEGPLHVSYCALAEAGSFIARGYVTSPRQQEEFFAMAGGRLEFELPLSGRLLFVSHLDALAALTRFDVTVNGETAFHVKPVSGAFGAGLGFLF